MLKKLIQNSKYKAWRGGISFLYLQSDSPLKEKYRSNSKSKLNWAQEIPKLKEY